MMTVASVWHICWQSLRSAAYHIPMLYTSLFEAQLVIAQVFKLLWVLGQKLQLYFQARLNINLSCMLLVANANAHQLLVFRKCDMFPGHT